MSSVKVMSVLAFVAAAAGVAGAAMGQVGVDGTIGAEWLGAGVTARQVPYAAGADVPLPNVTNDSNTVAYNTYFRFDGNYAYFAVQADPSRGGAYGSNFANIYIANNNGPNGSNIGMEVTNDRFFVPGVNGFFANPASGAYHSTWSTDPATGVTEVAIPTAFFTDDPLGMGFGPSSQIWWRSSQSLGYNLVTGAQFSPTERFGIVAIPAPGAAAVGLCGLAAMGRRRRR